LISNHQSFIDPLYLGLAIPRRAKFASRSTLIRGILGRYFRALGAIPLNREGVSLSGLKTVLAALGRRDALVYFPEGTRTPDGEIGTLKKGVGLIIRRAKSTVVLCGIAGAYEAWPRHSPVPLPGTIWMHFREWSMAESASNSEEDLMQSLSLALDGVTQEANRRREAYLRRSGAPISLPTKNAETISPLKAGSPSG
jgi:1-acyl-sn-glycerol-3-phosphate acyltransferase